MGNTPGVLTHKCSSCGHSAGASTRCPRCGSLLYWKVEQAAPVLPAPVDLG